MTSTPGPAPAHARLAPLPPWRTVVFTVGCALAGLVLFAITFAVSFNEITDGYIDIRAESRDRTYVVTMIEMAKGIVFRCI